MKFGYIFAISILSLCTKICDRMIDTLYRATPKSRIVVLIHVPLSMSLYKKKKKY